MLNKSLKGISLFDIFTIRLQTINYYPFIRTSKLRSCGI
jgi:hypothetical protein